MGSLITSLCSKRLMNVYNELLDSDFLIPAKMVLEPNVFFVQHAHWLKLRQTFRTPMRLVFDLIKAFTEFHDGQVTTVLLQRSPVWSWVDHDGVCPHQCVVHLHQENGRTVVKPYMLVIVDPCLAAIERTKDAVGLIVLANLESEFRVRLSV